MNSPVDTAASPQDPSTTPATWWVWFDRLLEEWFYSDHNIDDDPALAQQLQKEKTVIRQVKAATGAQAIEAVCPGYRADRRADPVSAPPRPLPPRPH